MVIVGGEMVICVLRCTTPVIENPTLLTRQPGGIRIVYTSPVIRTRRFAWPHTEEREPFACGIDTKYIELQLINNRLRGSGVRNRNFVIFA